MTYQYVTLVVAGGTPVRLANQQGAPYPTTGTGSIVFADGATLNNPTLNGVTFDGPFGFENGTVSAPAIFFPRGDDESTGFYSSALGNIDVAIEGVNALNIDEDGMTLVGDLSLSGSVTSGTWAGSVVGAQYGGTGRATLTLNGILYGNATAAVGMVAAGTTGQVLVATTGSAPSWAAPATVGVSSLSFGSTGLTPATPTLGAVVVAGTLAAANGGTGLASYAVGDLIYASASTTLAKRAAVAAGSVLASAGVTTAPVWSATIALTSLALGGATIGGNAVAVTGTSLFNSGVTLGAALTYGGVTLSNAVTGTGNMVLSASPTLSGTVGGALTFSGALTLSSALTYGGVALSNSVTGTGSMVLSAAPTLTGLVSLTTNAALVLTNQVTGAAAQTGTLTNAPKAGNPDFWLPVSINGTAGWVPWWHA